MEILFYDQEHAAGPNKLLLIMHVKSALQGINRYPIANCLFDVKFDMKHILLRTPDFLHDL